MRRKRSTNGGVARRGDGRRRVDAAANETRGDGGESIYYGFAAAALGTTNDPRRRRGTDADDGSIVMCDRPLRPGVVREEYPPRPARGGSATSTPGRVPHRTRSSGVEPTKMSKTTRYVNEALRRASRRREPGFEPGSRRRGDRERAKAVVVSGFEETDDDDAHTDVTALKKHQKKKASATKNDPVDSHRLDARGGVADISATRLDARENVRLISPTTLLSAPASRTDPDRLAALVEHEVIVPE